MGKAALKSQPAGRVAVKCCWRYDELCPVVAGRQTQ
jgi:hypothetical protein